MNIVGNISRITVSIPHIHPTTTITYHFRDEYVHKKLGGEMGFLICSDAENTPKGVTFIKNGKTITGVLESSDAMGLTFYLVPTEILIDNKRIYIEWIVEDGIWRNIGEIIYNFSFLNELAYKDYITLIKNTKQKPPQNVLSTNTQLILPTNINIEFDTSKHQKIKVLNTSSIVKSTPSSIKVGGESLNKKVLKSNEAPKSLDSDIVWIGEHQYRDIISNNINLNTNVTPIDKYLKATANNMSIGDDGNDVHALTGIGVCPSADFCDGVEEDIKYLERINFQGLASAATVDVSHITNKSKQYLEKTSISKFKKIGGEEQRGTSDTWSFTFNDETGEMIINGSNGTVPELDGSYVVATGSLQDTDTNSGTSVIQNISITDENVAQPITTTTTVATGHIILNRDGDGVLSNLSTHKAAALTELGEISTSDALSGVVVVEPAINLTLEQNQSQGTQRLTSEIINPTTIADIDEYHTISSIVDLAPGVAEAQVIKINQDQKMTAIENLTDVVAEGQQINVSSLTGGNKYTNAYIHFGDAIVESSKIDIVDDTIKVAQYDALNVLVE